MVLNLFNHILDRILLKKSSSLDQGRPKILDNWPASSSIGNFENRIPTPYAHGEPRIYFILSCARSGSTSLAHILDTATNGVCLSEPYPNLNVESRQMMEGRLEYPPFQILLQNLLPRVTQTMDKGLIHGEKNVTYGPFVPHLYDMLKCRFIFLKRDGRDVVTSLMNWHNEVFGNIYHECREDVDLSEIAKAAVSTLDIEDDTSDYARPRPLPGDAYYDRWTNMSRFEMVSWYWRYINTLYQQNLSMIPKEHWIEIDYKTVSTENIETLFDFLGLTGFDKIKVERMLTRRINSVRDRVGEQSRFPSWPGWTSEQISQFTEIASDTMTALGYKLDEY